MLRANGPEINRLIDRLRITDSSVNSFEEVARRTGQMSTRTLSDACNSKRMQEVKLRALAKVLGVPVEQIVLQESEHNRTEPNAISVVPAPSSTFVMNVMNFPPELMQTKPMANLAALPSQVSEHFLDVAVNLIASITSEGATLDEQRRQTLIDLARGDFISKLDDPSVTASFRSTRNPEKEKRFEKNVRSIIERAIEFLNSSDIPTQPPDQTFLDYFVECCQKCSDADAQELWAQILAAKIQRPQELTVRTIRFAQDLTREVAILFVRFCGLVFEVDTDVVSIRLNDDKIDYLDWAQLSFNDLLILADFGLVSLGVRAGRTKTGSKFQYFDQEFTAKREVTFRGNPLTTAGRELRALVRPTKQHDYFDAVWKMFGDDVGPPRPLSRDTRHP
jgi:hypothetical protein